MVRMDLRQIDNFLNGSLAVNERGYIPSQKPNLRHNNKPVMDEVFVHVGDYGKKPHENRRSLGCPTIHPEDYAGFRNLFDFDGEHGETGELIITRPTPPAPQGMGDLMPYEASRNLEGEEKAINYITDIVYPWG